MADKTVKHPAASRGASVRNSPKPQPSFAKASEGSPRLHPRGKPRGIRRRRIKLGVLGSGKGTNFQAIAEAIQAGKLEARIACVLSNVPDAYLLARAHLLGIPAEYIDPAPFKTKLDGEAELKVIERLHHHGVELVVLAGFMMIIKRRLLAAYKGRIINIHPALLPAFPGLEAWKQALNAGAKITGCTVHYVDEGMDTGPIILQRKVEVKADDTPETLHGRIQQQEYLAYPAALELVIKRLKDEAMPFQKTL